jgi:hypothetical protein
VPGLSWVRPGQPARSASTSAGARLGTCRVIGKGGAGCTSEHGWVPVGSRAKASHDCARVQLGARRVNRRGRHRPVPEHVWTTAGRPASASPASAGATLGVCRRGRVCQRQTRAGCTRGHRRGRRGFAVAVRVHKTGTVQIVLGRRSRIGFAHAVRLGDDVNRCDGPFAQAW